MTDYYTDPAIPSSAFTGEPPALIEPGPFGDVVWHCQCGDTGTSSSREWAASDVERHRQRTGCVPKEWRRLGV